MPDGQTLKDRATELLIKYKSGALVTQFTGIQLLYNVRHAKSNYLNIATSGEKNPGSFPTQNFAK